MWAGGLGEVVMSRNRLAVPILVVLFLLLAGAAWALLRLSPIRLPQFADEPSATKQQKPTAAKATAGIPGGETAAETVDETQPAFDISRIDPDGTSVFAGRAEPLAKVTILEDGSAIGTAQADENGEWTFATEHKFASADPKIGLTAQPASASQKSAEGNKKIAALTGDQGDKSQGATGVPSNSSQEAEPTPRSAKSVTSRMLKDLESMVDTARVAAQKKADEAKTQDTQSTEGTARAAVSAATEEVPARTEDRPSASETVAAKDEPVRTEARTAAANDDATAAKMPLRPEAGTTTYEAAATLTERPAATEKAEPASTGSASVTMAAVSPPAQVTPSVEPAARKSVPIPITFVFNESIFTGDGEKAAALLLEYLNLKQFSKVSLTGHADERGSNSLNMNLSRDRLDAVARYLKQRGFDGELELTPKGETEPYTGLDRSKYPKEELFQLDRRVELVITP